MNFWLALVATAAMAIIAIGAVAAPDLQNMEFMRTVICSCRKKRPGNLADVVVLHPTPPLQAG